MFPIGTTSEVQTNGIRHVVLIILSFLCLIWFYIMFINTTRSHAELKRGFTPFPSKWRSLHFLTARIWK